MNNLQFNFGRFVNLLRLDILSRKKKIAIELLATFGIFIIFAVLWILDLNDRQTVITQQYHTFCYVLGLIAGGVLWTSNIFHEFRTIGKRQTYLCLPASNLEKFACKWLLTFLAFPIIYTLCYALYQQMILPVFIESWTGITFNKISLFTSETFSEFSPVAIYLWLQGIFLLGAVAFNRYVLPKTILANSVFNIATAIVAVILFRIVFASYFTGFFSIETQDINVQPSQSFQIFMEDRALGILTFISYYLVPIVIWVIAFFKLKEKEL